MAGQLLGALPVVRAVGGLKKVRHNIDGFSYLPKSRNGLTRILKVAIESEVENRVRLSLMRRIARGVILRRRLGRRFSHGDICPSMKRHKDRLDMGVNNDNIYRVIREPPGREYCFSQMLKLETLLTL